MSALEWDGDADELAHLEADIERGMQTFIDVGEKLVRIRDRRLYRNGYATFEDYLSRRWQMSRRQGYRLMETAETAAVLDVSDRTHLNVEQLRPLAALPPEAKKAAWQKALDATDRTDRDGNPNPTGAEVAAAAAEFKRPTPGDQIIDNDGVAHEVAEVIDLDDEQACMVVDTEGECTVIPDDADDAGRVRLTQTHEHPATFPVGMVDLFATLIDNHYHHDRVTVRDVLDPFAGEGGIHKLFGLPATPVLTLGIELEPEWAEKHVLTMVGSALELPFGAGSIGVIATSPTYGNRMADHHDATDDSHRNTYRHCLNRDPSEDSSAVLQWGDAYREFHQRAWAEAVRVLTPGGLFILNIKDHIRGGERQPVSAWHVRTLMGLGLEFVDCVPFRSGGLPVGANSGQRVDAELVWAFTKGSEL